MGRPFWKTKTLEAMSRAEWESLCDGCGKCCLHKLEDEDTGRVHLTMVACRLLDIESCRCSNYPRRHRYVPECVRMQPDNVRQLTLPTSCAYRLLAEGRDLPAWHPLVSGDPGAVHAAAASVRTWAVSERDVAEQDFEDYIVASEDDDS
ncbi:MAG: YcgN family cysteine cluster protein [Polyangiales bacterium]